MGCRGRQPLHMNRFVYMHKFPVLIYALATKFEKWLYLSLKA